MGGTMSRRVGTAVAAVAIAAAVAGCAAGNPPARPNGTTTPGTTAPRTPAPRTGTMAPGTATPGAGAAGAGTTAPGVGANLVPGRGITGAGMAGAAGAGRAGTAASPAGYGGGMNNHLVRTHPDMDHGAQISQYIANLGALTHSSHYNEATARAGLMHGSSAGAVGAGHFGGGGGGGWAGAPVGVSTLVIGDMAFVGVNMKTVGAGTAGGAPGASAAGDPRGSAGPGLEGYLRQQVLDEFPHLSQVFVTTNPAMVSRIARVTGTANADLPARTLLGEMFDIARTLAGPVAAGTVPGAPQSAPGTPRGPHGGLGR